jgi:hypothetical protein
VGEKEAEPFQFTFNGFLKVAFQGSRVTSDAGLILVRELDERLGLEAIIAAHLTDSRHGLNTQFRLADLVRQSVYSRLAGYEDLNDAQRLSTDPTFRLVGSPTRWDRSAALTSTLHWFETELLTREENLVGLRARCMGSKKRAPTTGTSSMSATTRCSCSTITATAWRRSCARGTSPENLLVPEIDRQQAGGQRVAFRADAAFAKPAIYEALETRGVAYAIRIPANTNLELKIEDILFGRQVGRAATRWSGTGVSRIRRTAGPRPAAS